MGALVLLSGFTQKDNVNLIKRMKEIFLDRKYTLSYIPSITDKKIRRFQKGKNTIA